MSSPLVNSNVPSSQIFQLIAIYFESLTEEEKKAQIADVNGVIEMRIKKGEHEAICHIDLKKEAKVHPGSATPKADSIISMPEENFQKMFDGKLGSTRAWMTGKLKIDGDKFMAKKFDAILANAKTKIPAGQDGLPLDQLAGNLQQEVAASSS